jgi:hypothetical protein
VISEAKKSILSLFLEGRKQYKLMDFAKARECFGKALAIDPNDGPSKVFLERCDYYMENPPADDWDGVFIMKTK